MNAAVVTVTAVPLSGVVVDWRRTPGSKAVLSASRDGVMVYGSVFIIGPSALPQEWIDAARIAHEALVADLNADLSHMATHRLSGAWPRVLEVVTRDA